MNSQTIINILEMIFLITMLMAITFWAAVQVETHLATVSWNG
jgi:hypothetical protein